MKSVLVTRLKTERMYALVNDQDIPVDSLKSVVAGPRGEILVTGAAKTESDTRQVRKVLSSLHKKDVVSFNVVTSDWKTVTGKGAVTDLVMPTAPAAELPFYIKLKIVK